VLQQPDIDTQPDRLRQYARIVDEESNRLQRQVQSVLQIARNPRASLAADRTIVDLNALMTDLANAYSPNVNLDLQPEPALISADKYALETLLSNLVDNARKYCQPMPRITLSTRTEGKTLRWSVADNGIGMAREHHRAIFRQFYRIPTGDIHNVKGFGLGLYYVGQVARAHGWTIRLTSTPGVGSTFAIKSKRVFSMA
jgi:two-component system, OmpR family, phosphate regulon sensor histidine kinase PhoR